MQSHPQFHTKLNYKSIDIVVFQGNIAEEKVDAIVNAANEYLAHGGGVAGAIMQRGGFRIQKESSDYISKNGPVSVGNVAVTGPGHLPCKYVIHAVGPVYKGGWANEEKNLEKTITNTLREADSLLIKSISIPAISSGIFGFPKPLCAKIIVNAAKKFIDLNPNTSLSLIRFTNIDTETVLLMKKQVVLIFGSIDGDFKRNGEKNNETSQENEEERVKTSSKRTEKLDQFVYKKIKIDSEDEFQSRVSEEESNELYYHENNEIKSLKISSNNFNDSKKGCFENKTFKNDLENSQITMKIDNSFIFKTEEPLNLSNSVLLNSITDTKSDSEDNTEEII